MSTRFNGVKLVSLAVIALAAQAAQAGNTTTLDLGSAKSFSAFIFGDVTTANDIEGRLAVGGNLTAHGASFNYRTPAGTQGPAVIVGGDIKLTGGRIYNNAPATYKENGKDKPVDSTAGQFLPFWDPALNGSNYAASRDSYAVYGGKNLAATNASNPKAIAASADKNYTPINFGAAQAGLTQVSQQLSTLANTKATGTVTELNSGLKLTGTGAALEIFNVTTSTFANLVLSNVSDKATVIINYSGLGDVIFKGDMLSKTISLPGKDAWNNPNSSLESWNSNVLFNFSNAQSVTVGSWVGGSILAPKAAVYGGENKQGGGHLEGQLIAKSLNSKLEIGYQPWNGNVPPVTPVPEPETYALMMSGLVAVGFMARRRKQAK